MGAELSRLDVQLDSQLIKPGGNEAPHAREAHSMVKLGAGRILLFGGGCSSSGQEPQQFNDLFILDTTNWTWSKLNPQGTPPCPRTGQAAAMLKDGRVLIFGGCCLSAGYLNDVHLLDIANQRWQQVDPTGLPPCPRDKMSVCVNGSEIIVFGGFGPSLLQEPSSSTRANDSADADEDAKDDNNDADSDGDEWEEVQEDEMEEGNDMNSQDGMSFTWFDDLHVLDTETMNWKAVQASGATPTPRAAHAAFTISETDDGPDNSRPHMVVFGGRDCDGRQNDLYSLNLSTYEWTWQGGPRGGVSNQGQGQEAGQERSQKPSPAARSFHSMAVIPNIKTAICYGGIGAEGEYFKNLDILNTETFEWSTVADFAGASHQPRAGAGVVVLPEGISQADTSSETRMTGTSLNRLQGACQMVVFGGSSDFGGDSPNYFGDLHSIDLTPLVDVLSKPVETAENEKARPLGDIMDALHAGA